MIEYIVAATGVAVIFGHLASVPTLTSIHPAWVTMKFATAISFILAAGAINMQRTERPGQAAVLARFLLAYTSVNLFAAFANSSIVRYVVESETGVHTEQPGEPSIATLLCFAAVGVWAHGFAAKWIGAFVGVVSLVTIAGYLVGSVEMTWRFPGVSTAMAVHTGALFLMLSLAMMGRHRSSDVS